MRKITFWEKLTFIFGTLTLSYALFLFKLPPTLKRVNLIEGYIIWGFLLFFGILSIIFSLISIKSPEPLFKNNKIKTYAINLTLLFISILFILVILELFLQVTSQKSCRQNDELLHHSYIPNCESIQKTQEWEIRSKLNSLGLRNEEIQGKKNEQRILMLGDSFTLGFGIETNKTFSYLLEKKIKKENYNVDVINAGVTSYTPILEYLYLKEKGLKLQPDTVILTLNPASISTDYSYKKSALKNENDEILSIPSFVNKNIFKYLYSKIKVIQFLESPLITLDRKLPSNGKIGEKYFYNFRYDRYAATRGKLDPEIEEEYFSSLFESILLIKQLSIKENINFILVTYPFGHQVSGNEWKEGRHNFGFENDLIYTDRSDKLFQKFAMENDINLISMFDDFKKSDQFPLFFSYDGHFNQEGHKLASEIIYKELINLNILDKEFINQVPKKNDPYKYFKYQGIPNTSPIIS